MSIVGALAARYRIGMTCGASEGGCGPGGPSLGSATQGPGRRVTVEWAAPPSRVRSPARAPPPRGSRGTTRPKLREPVDQGQLENPCLPHHITPMFPVDNAFRPGDPRAAARPTPPTQGNSRNRPRATGRPRSGSFFRQDDRGRWHRETAGVGGGVRPGRRSRGKARFRANLALPGREVEGIIKEVEPSPVAENLTNDTLSRPAIRPPGRIGSHFGPVERW